jgi:hypothetical protein
VDSVVQVARSEALLVAVAVQAALADSQTNLRATPSLEIPLFKVEHEWEQAVQSVS